MSSAQMLFLQPCPNCGRTLCVPIELMGQRTVCRYCGAQFAAQSGAARRAAHFYGTLADPTRSVEQQQEQPDDPGAATDSRPGETCALRSVIVDTLFAAPSGSIP